MTDSELINKILKDNDSNALSELTERHSGIYIQTIEKFLPFPTKSVYFQDFIEQKINIVYEAAKSYNEEKGTKFVTWLGNLTKYKCLKERTISAKTPEIIEFNPEISEQTYLTPEKYLSIKNECDYSLNKVKKSLGKEYFDILKEVYFGGKNKTGKSLTKIAKEKGLSAEAIRQKHLKAIKFLKKLKNENSIQRTY